MASRDMQKIHHERAKKWPKVAIIIINWNGWQDTIECLESMLNLDYDNIEVIVIDNASSDGSLEKISSWCNQNETYCQRLSYNPDDLKNGSIIELADIGNNNAKDATLPILLIELAENTGFCLGNNIGMKLATSIGAEFFLILNNDTIVTPSFLKPMVEVAQKERNIGLVGGVICYAENPDSIWFAGGSFDKYLESRREHDGDIYSADKFERIFDTEWVSGCMTLIPRSTYDRLGGYFEGFFIWSEEWDYSLRAKKAGFRLVIASRARIFHKVGHSLGVMKPLSYYYGTRNRLILKRMHLPRSLRWPFLAFFLLSRIPRYSNFALQGRWDLVKAGRAAIQDYFLGKNGKWMIHAD